MLKVGFEEMNSGGVCPLKLNNNKIGEVTIGNRDASRVFHQITHIVIDEQHRGNHYLPKFLKIIEQKAKSEGFKIMELFDVPEKKLESLKNRGYENQQETDGISTTKKL